MTSIACLKKTQDIERGGDPCRQKIGRDPHERNWQTRSAISGHQDP